MRPEQLHEIKAGADAATPGPSRDDVAALVAEVERLRAVLVKIRRRADMEVSSYSIWVLADEALD